MSKLRSLDLITVAALAAALSGACGGASPAPSTSAPAAAPGALAPPAVPLAAMPKIESAIDAAEVIDRASFAAPKTPAAGIELVVVNGQVVWQDGAPTGARPGRALRRQQMQAEALP